MPSQLGDAFVFGRVLLSQLPQNFFGFIKVKELVPFILEEAQLAAVLLFVNGIHRLFVQFLGSIKDFRILANRVVNLLDAVMELVFEAEILVEAGFGQEIETMHDIVVAADAVNAPESLNESDRIPVEVVVDDVVTVLKV